MKNKPLKSLFDAARSAPLPRPSEDFPERVLAAIGCLPPVPSVLGQLAVLWPRWSAAAAAMLVLAMVIEYGSSTGSLTDLLTVAALTDPLLVPLGL